MTDSTGTSGQSAHTKRNENAAAATVSGTYKPGAERIVTIPENMRTEARALINRVHGVFALLERQGYWCRESFGNCLRCSVYNLCNEIFETIPQVPYRHPRDVAFALYTATDVQVFNTSGVLRIAYGTLFDGEAVTRYTGQLLVRALEAAGFDSVELEEDRQQVVLRLPRKRNF